MRSYNYSNKNRENNLIRKAIKVCRENPKKVKIFIIATTLKLLRIELIS